jgi:hypothetical protein
MNDDIADHLVMEGGTTSWSCLTRPGTGTGLAAHIDARPTKKRRRLDLIVGRAQWESYGGVQSANHSLRYLYEGMGREGMSRENMPCDGHARAATALAVFSCRSVWPGLVAVFVDALKSCVAASGISEKHGLPRKWPGSCNAACVFDKIVERWLAGRSLGLLECR